MKKVGGAGIEPLQLTGFSNLSDQRKVYGIPSILELVNNIMSADLRCSVKKNDEAPGSLKFGLLTSLAQQKNNANSDQAKKYKENERCRNWFQIQ